MLVERPKPKWHSLQILTQSPGAAPNECRPSNKGICDSKWSMAERTKQEGTEHAAEEDTRPNRALSLTKWFASFFHLEHKQLPVYLLVPTRSLNSNLIIRHILKLLKETLLVALCLVRHRLGNVRGADRVSSMSEPGCQLV